MSEKTMQIMDGKKIKSIPWTVIEAHDRQAQKNHGQTLERLSQRGGLGACEAVAIIEDRRWRRMDEGAAEDRLIELVALAARTTTTDAAREVDGEAAFGTWWTTQNPATGRAPCTFMDLNSARAAFFDALATKSTATTDADTRPATTIEVPVDAYLWLMGMGSNAFCSPDEGRHGAFWWRGAFNSRAGLDMMAIYEGSKNLTAGADAAAGPACQGGNTKDGESVAAEVDVEAERPRFETWAASELFDLRRPNKTYANTVTSYAWQGWLAARCRTQADAGKDALSAELLRLRHWFESQAKAISKGCGSSWDIGQCIEQIEAIDAATTTKPEKA